MDGLPELIANIPVQFCLASSGDREKINMSLTIAGLYSVFNGKIFSGDQVTRVKPFPDLFLLAAETMRAHPNLCLVVEDSVPGVKAAVAAGMNVVGFTGGSHAYPELSPALIAAGASRVFTEMRLLQQFISDSTR